MPPPSGEQHELVHGSQRATVVEVGGGIRAYAVEDRPVLDPYPLEAICDGGHGTPLIPWPNRLDGGRYSFDGSDYQLPLTEPAKGNAIHGLLRWRPWRAIERAPERVVMAARLHPLPGYPFTLDAEIAYELGEDGLTVRTSATNAGERACPYGSGQHPYLSPGAGLIDDCLLQLQARTRIVSDDRGLPTGREPAAGTDLDFSRPRRIGEMQIDATFTDLVRDGAGRATVSLTGTDGATVRLWADESYGLIQLFSGDTLAPGRRRLGLAAEPMTCPANAFRSGDGLIRLEPGESATSCWGVGLS